MSPTFRSLPVAGMTCMTPMAPTGLLTSLIEPRLLVALRRHQQVVERGTARCTCGTARPWSNFARSCPRSRASRTSTFFRYFCVEHVALQRAFRVAGQERVELGHSCGLSLRTSIAGLSSGAHRRVGLSTMMGKTCCQNVRDVIVDDVAGTRPAFTISRMSSSASTSGAGRLTGGLPAALQLRVELLHARTRRRTPGGRPPGPQGPAASAPAAARPGDDDRRDVPVRVGLVKSTFSPRHSVTRSGGDDVAAAGEQRRDEIVVRDRHE